jgi:uncharacterized protein YjiS (DUF1127 family)
MSAIDTISESTATDIQSTPSAVAGTLFQGLLLRLVWALKINRSRRALVNLTDEQLADVGISRHAAEQEARKVALF